MIYNIMDGPDWTRETKEVPMGTAQKTASREELLDIFKRAEDEAEEASIYYIAHHREIFRRLTNGLYDFSFFHDQGPTATDNVILHIYGIGDFSLQQHTATGFWFYIYTSDDPTYLPMEVLHNDI